jgi:high-affinity nickel-transport protein
VIDALAAGSLGFVVGVRHAAEADHVVAVAAIVARHGCVRRAVGVGALWGVGHSLALLVVGGALVAFRVAVPPRLGLAFELAVACMLVALGVRNLRPLGRARAVAGKHEAGDHEVGDPGAGDRRRPFVVGTVHGLAGSGAVALLAVAAIPTPAGALAYLAVFGAGTIAGMALVTVLVAVPAALAGVRMRRVQRHIRLAAGALSIAFGLALAGEIVRDGGLFSAVPRWDPR